VYPYLGKYTAEVRVERSPNRRLYECNAEAAERWVKDQVLGRATLGRADVSAFALDCTYAEIKQFFENSPTIPWTGEAMIKAAPH
jgi:hypothetical protein